jgi:hypothetical protein
MECYLNSLHSTLIDINLLYSGMRLNIRINYCPCRGQLQQKEHGQHMPHMDYDNVACGLILNITMDPWHIWYDFHSLRINWKMIETLKMVHLCGHIEIKYTEINSFFIQEIRIRI